MDLADKRVFPHSHRQLLFAQFAPARVTRPHQHIVLLVWRERHSLVCSCSECVVNCNDARAAVRGDVRWHKDFNGRQRVREPRRGQPSWRRRG